MCSWKEYNKSIMNPPGMQDPDNDDPVTGDGPDVKVQLTQEVEQLRWTF